MTGLTPASEASETGAETTEIDTDADLVARLGEATTDLTILPMRRLDDGRGVYPEDSLFAVKELRAAGFTAAFLDPPELRLFEVKKSLLGFALGSILLGISSSAGWDGIKWLVKQTKREKVPLQVTQYDGDDPSDSRSWSISGRPVDVLAALNKLQEQQSSAIEAPGVPSGGAVFVDAGPDDDLREARAKEEVDTRVASAEAQLAAARELVVSMSDHQEAERIARRALGSFASALNWAERRDVEEDVHRKMDAAGNWVRSAFGCALSFEDSTYYETCPVALAHNRIGLSVGSVATRVCSLCGQDLSECEHRRGRTYLVPGGIAPLGWCRVCLQRDGCEHRSHLQYRAPVVAIITKMDLAEVSIVGRPAHPDARIQKIAISTDDLRRKFGDGFEVGVRVSCDKCLSECGGLIKHDDVLHG